MKELFLVGTGFSLLVICCALEANGGSLIFLGLSGRAWGAIAGLGSFSSFGYFYFGK